MDVPAAAPPARVLRNVGFPRGILGLSGQVRNGYSQIRVHFRIKGGAAPEKLEEIVRQSQTRSALFDVLTNGTLVVVTADGKRG